MKILLPCLLAGILALSSCDKTDNLRCGEVTTTAPSGEAATLQAYIYAQGITAVADSRGFFYTIVRPGSGVSPTPCSNITVDYTGRLTNGQQFDAAAGATFNLSRTVAGWQEGLPLIGEGGSMVLYLPPSLGYGASASGSIPPNSITIFSIDLKSVQ